ncbi:MAG: glycogen synthase [Candidatus Bruticola sp.]
MKVLFLAAEAVPYVKVGGLGDVAGALPGALRRLGHDVRLMMPRYGLLDSEKLGLRKNLDNFEVKMDWRREECQLWCNPKTGDRFIENHYFFGSRFQVYGCGDEVEQFVLFCRAALEACRLEGWYPDVIHANDWHTAAALRIAWAAPRRPALVFTIHNMAHQGNQRPDGWPLLGVYDGRSPMNLMEQAIWCADKVTTVSPNYAKEICTEQHGFGLDGMLRLKGTDLSGIVNGIDVESYNPVTDSKLYANYKAGEFYGKERCKEELLREYRLHGYKEPLVGLVSRLDFQKGIDLVLGAIDSIIHYSDLRVIILGSGDPELSKGVVRAAQRHPGRVGCYIGFDPVRARRIYAGCDMFLMPSLFEPCGLSQMIAMRYGTLPIARETGGLVDTIKDNFYGDGTGYLFRNYTVDDMLTAFGRALEHYLYKPELWYRTQIRAMNSDFSWERSAKSYAELYKEACK